MKFFVLGICIICSGCATLLARSESSGFINFHVDGMYPATRMDVEFIGLDPVFGVLSLLDLPMSLVFDTLLSPYDAFQRKH